MNEHFRDCYRLLVQGIEIDCFLGVYEHEQQSKRPVTVEVELYVPHVERIERHDDIADTVNYEKVVAAVERVVEGRRFHLVETLCARLADEIGAIPGIRALRVGVTKPQPMPRARAVSVEVWRQP